MDYAQVAQIAETWGLIYLFGLFLVLLAYVFWPRNRKKFRDAAQIPFRDGED